MPVGPKTVGANMFGIKRNKHVEWFGTLKLLPIDFLEVFSFGYLTISHFRIVKNTIPWTLSLCCLLADLVIVLSLGYLTATWAEEY